jgi:DNA repair protein RecO (recombination protein O)
LDIAYVLHRRRYRESSLIVDFLTRELGRVSAVARGALRKNSRLGASLQPLIPVQVAFTGRSELLTLKTAEAGAAAPALDGPGLYSVFYVNELVVRLTAPHDANAELFEVYRSAAEGLARREPLEPLLRRFEKRLLDAVGLGLSLETDAGSGMSVEGELEYRYVPEQGPMRATGEGAAPPVHGETLRALAQDAELSERGLREAKQLMRYVLNHHLEGRVLSSRKLFEAHAGGNS